MVRLHPIVAAVLCCLAGCAGRKPTVVGVPSSAGEPLRFTGQPFTIAHYDAHPRVTGPSSEVRRHGGRIAGEVCNFSVDYGVEHLEDHTELRGFSIDAAPNIDIREHQGVRAFTGVGGARNFALTLSDDAILGQIGDWSVALRRQDDAFAGTVRHSKGNGEMAVIMKGRSALLAMPAADQAVVLPLLVGCVPGRSSEWSRTLLIGVGGPATVFPGFQ